MSLCELEDGGDSMAGFTNIGRGIKKSVSGTTGFFKSGFQELKKVRWPSRKELFNFTAVVITVVVLLALFFFVIDMGIAQVVSWITG
jgi:preprotein translocase subunit SecE